MAVGILGEPMEEENGATVLISGGIDSAACAHLLKNQGFTVRGVFIDYGQAAVTHERQAVKLLAQHMDIPYFIYELKGGLSFSSGELIGRNAFLLSAALFCRRGMDSIISIGVHAGTPYYDCSKSFIEAMSQIISEQTDGRTKIAAPFLDWSKSEILQYFQSSNLPLDFTYSCETGVYPVCGRCASCLDRRALKC